MDDNARRKRVGERFVDDPERSRDAQGPPEIERRHWRELTAENPMSIDSYFKVNLSIRDANTLASS